MRSSAPRVWGPPACALLVGLLVALVPLTVIPPVYSADTQVFVTTRTDARNPTEQLLAGGSFAVDRVRSYAALASTPRVLEPVVTALEPGTTSAELGSRVTADVPADTVLIDLRVRAGDPAAAARLTDAVAARLARVIEDLERPPGSLPSPVRATVLREATPPDGPLWPRAAVVLGQGLVAGLAAGVVAAFLLRRRDTAIDGAQDAARVSGLPVLASVGDGAGGELGAEDRQTLSARLQFAFVDDRPGVLAVTSADAEVDMAAVAGGLASGLQRAGSRACLVDGDLRRPSVAGDPGAIGLTSVLAGSAGPGDAVGVTDDGVTVLTAGPVPPNPAELLASGRMAALLAELSGSHDVVVVAGPPLLPVADGPALAGRAGAVLLLVRDRATPRSRIRLALEALARVDARALGLVLVTGDGLTGRPRTRTGARRGRRSAPRRPG